MTEIFVMTRDHEFWEKTAALAEHCSWRAGSHLAQKMRDNDFAEWERAPRISRVRSAHKQCALPTQAVIAARRET